MGPWQAKADPTPSSVHFTAVGDYGTSANATAVLNEISSLQPDLNLALGDLSYGATGQEQSWCNLVTNSVGAGFSFELVSGNHESNGENGNINDFSACLTNQLPGAAGTYGREWYVDVPKVNPLVRFLMISPALDFGQGSWSYAAGTTHYQWTASAIDGARAKGVPWVVVGMHKICLSAGTYSGPGPAQPARGQEGRPGPHRPRSRLPTHQSAGAHRELPVDPICVVDSDSSLTKGSGTVWGTVATGGQTSTPSTPPTRSTPTSWRPAAQTRARPGECWTST